MTYLPQAIERHPRTAQWIDFASPGRATVLTGRVELGQGVASAFRRIAAAELGLDESQIDIVAGDTERTPDEGATVGSRSMQEGGLAMRLAASAARWELLERAAELLQSKPTALEVRRGEILKDGEDTGMSYWTMSAERPLEGTVERYASPLAGHLRPPPSHQPRRFDTLTRLRGEAYIHDLALPGMLHGRTVQPPHNAVALDTPEELLNRIAGPEIRLHRDGMFIGITSEDEHLASRAAERLDGQLKWKVASRPNAQTAVERESVIAGSGMADRVNEESGGAVNEDIDGANPEYSIAQKEGELPAAAPSAATTVRRPCIAHSSIGPCCALAQAKEGKIRIWTHSQGVFALRASLAAVLNVPEQDIAVHHVPGAGCYGHNGADDVALEAALMARNCNGRPVRVAWRRKDEFQAGPLSPSMQTTAEGWLANNGRMAGIRVSVASPRHSSRPAGASAPNLRAACHLDSPIPIKAPSKENAFMGSIRNAAPPYELDSFEVLIRETRAMGYRPSALRSLGAQVNIAAVEALVDELASAAGADPAEFRLAHLKDHRAQAVIERARDLAGGLQGASGFHRGMGYSQYKNSSGYCAVIAEVEVDADVRVRRFWAAVDVGVAVDPSGTVNQIEGGILQAASITLKEAVRFEDGRVSAESWDDYPVLTFREVPETHVEVIDNQDSPPLGAGEIAAGPTTAALLNAVARGLGSRPSNLPLTRDSLLDFLNQ